MTSLREVYCAPYEQIGAPVTESIRPHPVLEEYYPVQSDRQSFVDELFNGSAKYYNHIGRMLDWGSGPMYRRQALQRAGLKKGMRLLDVATGTGLGARGGAEGVGDPRGVIGIDPNGRKLPGGRLAPSGPPRRGPAGILPVRAERLGRA